METKDISKEYIFNNEDHTLGTIIQEELLKMDNIKFVGYSKDHPLENKIRIIIVSKNPDNSLNTAIKNLISKYKTLKNEINKL